MAIPKLEQFLYPFLLQLRDKDKKKDEIKEALIKHFNLTKEECIQKTNRGSTFVIDSHLGWVRQWLRRAMFIEIPTRGTYRITQRGREYLDTHTGLTEKDLLEYPEYQDYYFGGKGTNRRKKGQKLPSQPPKEKAKPEKEGLVYILTNPSFKALYIKIGYTDRSIQERLRDLNNTSVPYDFRVYALLKTRPGKSKEVEGMIHELFESYRMNEKREFFNLNPSEALEKMKKLAKLLDATVIQYDDDGKEKEIFDYSK